MRGASRPRGPDAAARRILDVGLEQLSLPLDERARGRMMELVGLLERWNRVSNLTRIAGAASMVRLHLLDSLTAVPHLRGDRVLDLGTGPGLPGIPLALACPERTFLLLDANAKKLRFCQHAVSVLGLGNVGIVHARAEAYLDPVPWDTVVSRAVAPLARLLEWSRHLRGPGTRLLSMKGRYPEEELEELGPMEENARVTRVHVPGLTVERHLVLLDEPGPAQWPE